MPISAIIFGGRRASTVPLVLESFDWPHGVYLGATMGSETTAAATGKVGVIRRDPMAMLPFCGYNIGRLLRSLASDERPTPSRSQDIHGELVQKGSDGAFLWPGYSENMRVLKWIVDRAQGRVGADETPVGFLPRESDLDLTGSDISNERIAQAMAIKPEEWLPELDLQEQFFASVGRHYRPNLKYSEKLS